MNKTSDGDAFSPLGADTTEAEAESETLRMVLGLLGQELTQPLAAMEEVFVRLSPEARSEAAPDALSPSMLGAVEGISIELLQFFRLFCDAFAGDEPLCESVTLEACGAALDERFRDHAAARHVAWACIRSGPDAVLRLGRRQGLLALSALIDEGMTQAAEGGSIRVEIGVEGAMGVFRIRVEPASEGVNRASPLSRSGPVRPPISVHDVRIGIDLCRAILIPLRGEVDFGLRDQAVEVVLRVPIED